MIISFFVMLTSCYQPRIHKAELEMNIIPKPLIPLDDKTISEHIINNFHRIGCNDFYMSVNYKSKIITG